MTGGGKGKLTGREIEDPVRSKRKTEKGKEGSKEKI